MTKNSMINAPVRPMAAAVRVAKVNDKASITPLIIKGPVVVPVSPNKRQTPRNSPLPSVGENSAPRVKKIPLPSPLPKPINRTTAIKEAKLVQKGTNPSAIENIPRQGTETHFLP